MDGRNKGNFSDFPEEDAQWSKNQWRALIEHLVASDILNWRQVAALVLGHLNPSQVGTSIATKKSFQRHYEKRECWRAVRAWHFQQSGRCVEPDCDARLELQADHLVPKEVIISIGEQFAATPTLLTEDERERLERDIDRVFKIELANAGYADIVPPALQKLLRDDLLAALVTGVRGADLAEVADRLENMILRCRRHNVVRRPSHKKGGLTFLTAEAALMWLLFVKRPTTSQEFAKICRTYGLSMANIRFEEAWAMARWLERIKCYLIDPESKH